MEVSYTWNQEQYTLSGTLLGLDTFETFLNYLKIVFFFIRDRGGGGVWCYNPPQFKFPLAQ